MMNFEQMLMDFAQPKKRLLPSEQAMVEIGQGANEAIVDSLEVDARPSGQPMVQGLPEDAPKANPWLGALRGASRSFQNTAPIEHSPMTVMDDKPILLKGYANGGVFDEEEEFIVGERGPEKIRTYRGGGGEVIPMAERNIDDLSVDERANRNTGELYGLDQTVASDERPSLLTGTTRDELIAKKRQELAEAMKVKPEGWKDFGFSLLQGVNNFFNRQNAPIKTWGEAKRDRRVAPIAEELSLLEGQRKIDQEAEDAAINRRYKTAQAVNLEAQPGDRDAERERKAAADKAKYDFQVKTLDWKKEDREKYWEWEEVKQKALREKNDRDYKLAVRKQDELERHNKATEGIAIAREQGLNRRQQIGIEAKRVLSEYQEAQRNGRAEQANALKERLAQLKREDDALKATGEAIP